MRSSLCLFVVIAGLSVGCSDPPANSERNTAYMRDVVGDVVLSYRKNKGELPQTFDEALRSYPNRLGHRGDAYGRGYFYKRLTASSFALHCVGPNGRSGDADDAVFVWDDDDGWRTLGIEESKSLKGWRW
jgi:hypothetical protein